MFESEYTRLIRSSPEVWLMVCNETRKIDVDWLRRKMVAVMASSALRSNLYQSWWSYDQCIDPSAMYLVIPGVRTIWVAVSRVLSPSEAMVLRAKWTSTLAEPFHACTPA